MSHTSRARSRATKRCLWRFEVLGENLLGLVRRHARRGVSLHFVRQIAKQVLLGLQYLHERCGMVHTNMKPEHVLVAIDDVERVIRGTFASPTRSPIITGVPPVRGRGGNVTPRAEGVYITGSQPLPSPSPGSSASGSYVDKWVFSMSKIDGEASASADADGAAAKLGSISLQSTSPGPAFVKSPVAQHAAG